MLHNSHMILRTCMHVSIIIVKVDHVSCMDGWQSAKMNYNVALAYSIGMHLHATLYITKI